MEFLDKIVKYKQKIVSENINKLKDIKKEVSSKNTKKENLFLDNLQKAGLSVIAEVKVASPSEGNISNFSVEKLSEIYEKGKADCVSVLTEDRYFKGSKKNLTRVKKIYSGPVLMKDFIISQYQIYQAAYLGADAILLIKAILGRDKLLEFTKLASQLGMYSLVELHYSDELSKLSQLLGDSSIKIIGVNSRNLNTLKINLKNHKQMIRKLPVDKIKIAESGIKTLTQARLVHQAGYDGVLVGKGLIKRSNPLLFIRMIKEIW